MQSSAAVATHMYIFIFTPEARRTAAQQHRLILPPAPQVKHTNTFPGGLEAVVDVYPLDVVGERGVGQQGSVPVDCV